MSRVAVEALRRALISVPTYSIAWVARDGAEAVRAVRGGAARRDAHGSDHAGHGRRGGDAAHHGQRRHAPFSSSRRRHAQHEQGVRGNGRRRARRRQHAHARGRNARRIGERAAREDPARSGSSASRTPLCLARHARTEGAPRHVSDRDRRFRGRTSRGRARAARSRRVDFPRAVLVVQHVDAEFVDSMAEWFDSQCELAVSCCSAKVTKPHAGLRVSRRRRHASRRATPTAARVSGRAAGCALPALRRRAVLEHRDELARNGGRRRAVGDGPRWCAGTSRAARCRRANHRAGRSHVRGLRNASRCGRAERCDRCAASAERSVQCSARYSIARAAHRQCALFPAESMSDEHSTGCRATIAAPIPRVGHGAPHRRSAVRGRSSAPVAGGSADDLAFHLLRGPAARPSRPRTRSPHGHSARSRDAGGGRARDAAALPTNDDDCGDADRRAVHEGGCAGEA